MDKNGKTLLKEASYFGIFDGLTTPFIIPFALLLGATNSYIGLIAALPYIASVIAQIPSVKVSELYQNREKLTAYFSALSVLAFIPILFLSVLGLNTITYFVFFVLLHYIFFFARIPLWTSIVAEVIPKDKYGIFFSKRFMRLGLFSLTFSIVAGFYLDLFNKRPIAFAVMFLVAILFGLLSIYYFMQVKDAIKTHVNFELSEFFKLKKEFKMFLVFICIYNFAFMFASPFFSVYMLKDLGLSYSYYVIFSAVSTLATIFGQRHWGLITDRFGDKRVATIAVAGTSLVPLLFLFINKTNTVWIILIFLISGISWAAFDLSSFNLLLDLTDKKRRTVQIAEYHMITSIPLIISPLISGFVSMHVNFILKGIPLIFALSFILRISSLFFLYPLTEPRIKNNYSVRDFLVTALTFHPIRSLESGITRFGKQLTNFKLFRKE